MTTWVVVGCVSGHVYNVYNNALLGRPPWSDDPRGGVYAWQPSSQQVVPHRNAVAASFESDSQGSQPADIQ